MNLLKNKIAYPHNYIFLAVFQRQETFSSIFRIKTGRLSPFLVTNGRFPRQEFVGCKENSIFKASDKQNLLKTYSTPYKFLPFSKKNI